MKKIIIAVSTFILLSTPALASETEAHHFPGVFLGATTFDSETEFSYGLEYEYKFNDKWGAGFVYEKTDDAHHGAGVDVSLISAYYHPWKGLRLGLGFGQEEVGSYTDHHHHHHSSHEEDLIRVSASYDFHLGRFGVAPTLAFDSIDGETATIVGVAFVMPF